MRPIKEIPRLDRPREKLEQRGVSALSDRELVAAIIGGGTRDRNVLEVAGDVVKRLEKGPPFCYDELRGITGIGPAKASQIMACFELSRRYGGDGNTVKITAPQDILPLVAFLQPKKQEYFICITLNGAGEVIGNRTITVGLLNHSLVHPREVFADAITDRAASIICVHNHPSGSLEASSQDIAITRQLVSAGEILGIRVLDHLIITKNGHLSLKEHGIL
jgi:DNA repair protein RadC